MPETFGRSGARDCCLTPRASLRRSCARSVARLFRIASCSACSKLNAAGCPEVILAAPWICWVSPTCTLLVFCCAASGDARSKDTIAIITRKLNLSPVLSIVMILVSINITNNTLCIVCNCQEFREFARIVEEASQRLSESPCPVRTKYLQQATLKQQKALLGVQCWRGKEPHGTRHS